MTEHSAPEAEHEQRLPGIIAGLSACLTLRSGLSLSYTVRVVEAPSPFLACFTVIVDADEELGQEDLGITNAE